VAAISRPAPGAIAKEFLELGRLKVPTGRVGQAEEAFREGSDAMVARRVQARTEEIGLYRRIEPIHVVAAEVSDNAKPGSRIQCDLGIPSVHVEVRGISRGRLCPDKGVAQSDVGCRPLLSGSRQAEEQRHRRRETGQSRTAGRKRDFADAERLVKRLVARELTLSFVPDAEQRLWRTVTRRK